MSLLPTGTPLGVLQVIEIYHLYDGPKLFACANLTGQLYLVLWLGDDDLGDEWLYVPVSQTRLGEIRSGRLSLRDASLAAEGGWVWRVVTPLTDEDPAVATVLPSNALTENDLPSEDSYLEVRHESLPRVVETAAVRAARTNRETLDFALKPRHTPSSVIQLSTLGHTTLAMQGLVEALVLAEAGYRSRRGRIPGSLQQDAALYAVATFESSFGIRLESGATADLFGETRIGTAIRHVFELLHAESDAHRLRALLSEFGGRVAARYTVFLGSLANGRSDLRLAWGRPVTAEIEATAEVAWEVAGTTAGFLAETIAQFSEELTLAGRLEGVDVYNRTFNFVSYETGERYSGRVASEFLSTAEKAATRVPAEYVARLLQTQEVNPTTEQVRERYTLIALREMPSSSPASDI